MDPETKENNQNKMKQNKGLKDSNKIAGSNNTHFSTSNCQEKPDLLKREHLVALFVDMRT